MTTNIVYGVTPPVLNINGSDGQRLLDAHVSALEGLRNAEELLARTGPNGRDFQTVPTTVFMDATREHTVRMQRLYALKEEVEQIAMAICRQMDARQPRRKTDVERAAGTVDAVGITLAHCNIDAALDSMNAVLDQPSP